MAASISIVSVLLISTVLLNEKVSKQQWIGAAIISTGIVLYNLNF